MKALFSGLLCSVILLLSTAYVSAAPVLVMVEQPGCVYCEQWDAKIAPIYPKTPEGKYAPLMRVQLRDAAPDGMTYARRVNFTPTFILMNDGEEKARIEGYPGEDFFWGLLGAILQKHTGYAADPAMLTGN